VCFINSECKHYTVSDVLSSMLTSDLVLNTESILFRELAWVVLTIALMIDGRGLFECFATDSIIDVDYVDIINYNPDYCFTHGLIFFRFGGGG